MYINYICIEIDDPVHSIMIILYIIILFIIIDICILHFAYHGCNEQTIIMVMR